VALDVLSGEIATLTRDQWRERYLRSYRVRNPDADTAPDSMPWIDASCIADQLVILSEDARRVGQQIPLSGKTGEALDEAGGEVGLPRAPAAGGAGYVSIRTSTGGATVTIGDTLTDLSSSLQFRFTGATTTYFTGDELSITAVDGSTGPGTNLAGGTVLVWDAPAGGLFPNATIVTQPDGSGFSGGANVEGDDDYRERIRERLANGAASGNDAAYQQLVENTVEHGVAVQKAFTYPAIVGPGSIGIAFVLVQTGANATRIPNGSQISTVQAYVTAQAEDALPADDSTLWPVVTAQDVSVVLEVEWSTGSPGWADQTPWPPYYSTNHAAGAPGGIIVDATGTNTATSFKLKADNADYTGVIQPAVGQTIAFYKTSTGEFFKKRILSFTGAGPWVVTVDTSNAASDTSYAPVAGQRAMPWSESLANLSTPIIDHFATLGPGEMIATFADPGLRQRRSPASPKDWPSVITNHLVVAVLDVPDVNDAVVTEGLGTTATVGSVAEVHLMALDDLSAFEK
jgi:uncharacterized phage protein gp47/JayE